ncbi:PTS sugar transporter subunit IIA [Pendulispora brunnea]|uniref:PTS sugar transporter subunit IIA n=1 Tax=Pendulispora brunnea TaxID=2905690 RepID=A0ABZ2K3B4_9BACT
MNLTVHDAARMLNVSERAIYRWIREKSIPVHRVNDHYRFHRAELLEWATSRGIRVSSEELYRTPANGTSMPRLSEALEAGGVHYGLVASDRESLLRAVVDVMPIDEEDRDLVYDFLLAREALGSTGVGDGIAIPHVRNPVVLHVSRPSITLAFLEHPVDFKSVDSRPVHTVFSLVSGTIRSHLYLLSRLSAALHDSKFKESVLNRAPREQIFEEARRIEGALSLHPSPPEGSSET